VKIIYGNLLDDALLATADAVCITTNLQVGKNGAVMGAGVAKAAATKWPWMPVILGYHLDKGRRETTLVGAANNYSIIALPTKDHWKDKSDIKLIIKSASELKLMAGRWKWNNVLLPPMGCGLGGLEWNDVKAATEHLLDDRFTVVFLKKV
jgi:hypothetical protein